jgi:hypothetical protein
MKTVREFIEELTAESAYGLPSYADCGTPDTRISPGAKYLVGIRDAVARAITDGEIVPGGQDASGDRSDVISRIANDAHLIYTHNKWLTFTDLAAYQRAEDVAGDFGGFSTMDAWADACLYSVAEELCHGICRELDGQCVSEDDDQGDDASE